MLPAFPIQNAVFKIPGTRSLQHASFTEIVVLPAADSYSSTEKWPVVFGKVGRVELSLID